MDLLLQEPTELSASSIIYLAVNHNPQGEPHDSEELIWGKPSSGFAQLIQIKSGGVLTERKPPTRFPIVARGSRLSRDKPFPSLSLGDSRSPRAPQVAFTGDQALQENAI